MQPIRHNPGIELWETNVDAMCMWLVKNPQDYDVLVASNMFGDIISDLAAQLVGGLGFAASGNIGDNFAVFEPTHGSAPKDAGQYKVNPIAMIQSVRLMLDWLGEKENAIKLEHSIGHVIKEGKVKTYDLEDFYHHLRKVTSTNFNEFNIEGAAAWKEHIILLNRGNNNLFLINRKELIEYLKLVFQHENHLKLLKKYAFLNF